MLNVSRLWRTLGLEEPLIRVWSQDDLELDDHMIQSISIHRGAAEPAAGPQPHTLEVATTQPLSTRTGYRVYCDITPHGIGKLYALTGASQTGIKRRFYGRIGRQTMDDQGPGKIYSTLQAASWQAQLPNTAVEYNEIGGTGIGDFLVQISRPSGVDLPYMPAAYAPAVTNSYGTIAHYSAEPVTYSDAIQKWCTDLGIYVKTHRDGTDWFVTNEWRTGNMFDALDTMMPLTRSQAISPATWEQPQENIWRTHRVYWTGDDPQPLTYAAGTDVENPRIPEVKYDMIHAAFYSNESQPRSVARAGFHTEHSQGYNIPEITVDLLYLATSDVNYHRTQAKQLLEMEVGDPILLSGDWNEYLRGVHFVSGITETITPDGWEMKLSIAPANKTVGEPSPEVPPRIWESAGTPWTEAGYAWNNE